MASSVITFTNGIQASVVLMGDRTKLDIIDNGELIIPEGIVPGEFSLIILVPTKSEILVNQKNVGQDRGEYNDLTNLNLGDLTDLNAFIVPSLQVSGKPGNMRTVWHKEKSNRVDCWMVSPKGFLRLFQVGIITHNGGKTFRILGEYRWRGQMFRNDNHFVAKPEYPTWGSLESRKMIFDSPDFMNLVLKTELRKWTGKEKELNPPLGDIPENSMARVNWYNPFAGNAGQGIAVLKNGESVWVHGNRLNILPDVDGIKRLWRNQLLQFKSKENWGTKPNSPQRLNDVTIVNTSTPVTTK